VSFIVKKIVETLYVYMTCIGVYRT